ncbi:MAG: HlyD family efflux transporter periplasmic adaptor subunit, partial [Patescibacteria group bacterium]
ASSKLSDYTIKAPFDGIVTNVVSISGYDASANTVLATVITPQQIAEISLNEVDAANVKIGQKATLTFDAVSDLTITGSVAQIDTIGTVSQGVVSYGAKIAMDTQDDKIKPGMSVSANIIINAKADVLLVPNSAVKASGSSSYVEVISGVTSSTPTAEDGSVASPSGTNKVTVEIGLSNDTYTEITSGLKEGDLVVEKSVISTGDTTKTQTNSLMQLFGGGGRTSNNATKSSASASKSTGGSNASSGNMGGPPLGM